MPFGTTNKNSKYGKILYTISSKHNKEVEAATPRGSIGCGYIAAKYPDEGFKPMLDEGGNEVRSRNFTGVISHVSFLHEGEKYPSFCIHFGNELEGTETLELMCDKALSFVNRSLSLPNGVCGKELSVFIPDQVKETKFGKFYDTVFYFPKEESSFKYKGEEYTQYLSPLKTNNSEDEGWANKWDKVCETLNKNKVSQESEPKEVSPQEELEDDLPF